MLTKQSLSGKLKLNQTYPAGFELSSTLEGKEWVNFKARRRRSALCGTSRRSNEEISPLFAFPYIGQANLSHLLRCSSRMYRRGYTLLLAP